MSAHVGTQPAAASLVSQGSGGSRESIQLRFYRTITAHLLRVDLRLLALLSFGESPGTDLFPTLSRSLAMLKKIGWTPVLAASLIIALLGAARDRTSQWEDHPQR